MKEYAPLVRRFSAIEKLQAPYTLTYALTVPFPGGPCRLSVFRTGSAACHDSLSLDASPRCCYALLLYLYENAVQPELWRDVLAEFYPLAVQNDKKGGVSGDR